MCAPADWQQPQLWGRGGRHAKSKFVFSEILLAPKSKHVKLRWHCLCAFSVCCLLDSEKYSMIAKVWEWLLIRAGSFHGLFRADGQFYQWACGRRVKPWASCASPLQRAGAAAAPAVALGVHSACVLRNCALERGDGTVSVQRNTRISKITCFFLSWVLLTDLSGGKKKKKRGRIKII